MKKYNDFCRSIHPNVLTGLLFILCMFLAFPAGAQGLSQVNTLMDSILDALTAVSVTAVTIAVILTGYKMAFKGDSFGDCAPVLVGGVVIGAASPIANMLV